MEFYFLNEQVDNLRAARPTRFVGVPRVWEKIQEKMEEVGRKSGPAKRALVIYF